MDQPTTSVAGRRKRGATTRALRVVAAAAAVAALSLAGAVSATSAPTTPDARSAAEGGTHDENGQIVFGLFDKSVGDTLVYTVNPDGSHLKKVVPEPLECMTWSPDGRWIVTCGRGGPHPAVSLLIDPHTGAEHAVPRRYPKLNLACPVMSPDGERLACGQFDNAVPPSRNGLYTIRVSDGRGLRRLTSNQRSLDEVGSFSPNGRWLTVGRDEPNEHASLWLVRTDGTRLHQLTAAGKLLSSSSGDWSPDGHLILFSRQLTPDLHRTLWTIHPDGTGLRRFHLQGTHHCGGPLDSPVTHGCGDPHWSPDGKKIVFVWGSSHGDVLATVNADGTGFSAVYRSDTEVAFPDWGTHPLAGK